MPDIGGLFGEGTTANQLLVWGVLNQLLSTLMGPFTLALANVENSAFPNVPLSPDAAAAAAARRLLTVGTAQDEAAKSGVDTDVLATMIKLGQRAPDISSVFELYRRKMIGLGGNDPEETSVVGALTDMGIQPHWHHLLAELTTQVPTVAEVMNAWLEGQIEEPEARKRYLEAGGDPTWFQTSYDANGQAPTPTQALELLNRRIIPRNGTGPRAVSYQQAFLEGPWRNKWLGPFLALAEYLPPPRTVTAMYHEGAITRDKAAEYLSKQGLSTEAVGYYLHAKAKVATKDEKHLTKADLLDLYKSKVMTKAQAASALKGIGYTDHDAKELLSLTDIRVQVSQTNSAAKRIQTLFIGGKIDAAEALATLVKLGVDRAQATQLLQVWKLESAHAGKELTAAQIEGAVYYKFLTQSEGLARLVGMGYSHHDAWIALSLRLKAKAGPEPAKGS